MAFCRQVATRDDHRHRTLLMAANRMVKPNIGGCGNSARLGAEMDSSAFFSLADTGSTATRGAWPSPYNVRLPRSPTECEPGGVHGTASWNSVMASIADPTKRRFAGKNCKGSTILTLGGSDPLVWLSYERLERMEREVGQDRARGPRSSNRARLLTGSRNRNQTGRSATNGEPCTGRTALGR